MTDNFKPISWKRLDKALRQPGLTPFGSVVIDGIEVKDIVPIGAKVWFEYHCNESHDSPDAPIWYRSQQQVTVIGIPACEAVCFETLAERAECALQIMYQVRFADGLEWSVFEDELLQSPDHFEREPPPTPLKETA